MVERNLRIKRRARCSDCGADLLLIAYVDGRCDACDRTSMVSLPGSLAAYLAPIARSSARPAMD
jgi:hypothetical protein